MKKSLAAVFLLILFQCTERKDTTSGKFTKPENFTKELTQLQEYFHIPGMAVIVVKDNETYYENYIGYADVENQVPMDSTTIIPMASLTKVFSGVLLNLAYPNERNEPINNFLENSTVGDSVTIHHVATHTSQGRVGKHFYYSNRYSWLTKVIEKDYGMPYDKAMQANTIDMYDMYNTFLLADSTHGRNLAKPYLFEGELKPGFVDYGYSASAGIASTVRDMVKLRKIISFKQSNRLYSYGLFRQEIEREAVYWAYGQYDCYSSLFIHVPGKDMTVVMAANNSLMSDPARLIYGDIRSSLFALSFFRNYLQIELPREQLRAQALADSFMGMADSTRVEHSKEALRTLFRTYPDYNTYAHLTLLHNLMFLKNFSVNEFDKQIKDIGFKLLEQDPDNPYANVYMGNYYQSKNIPDSTRIYYRRIVDAKNFDKNWYTREAEAWLTQNASSKSGTKTPRP